MNFGVVVLQGVAEDVGVAPRAAQLPDKLRGRRKSCGGHDQAECAMWRRCRSVVRLAPTDFGQRESCTRRQQWQFLWWTTLKEDTERKGMAVWNCR